MASEKKNKVRRILLGEEPKAPTTGAKIKESVFRLARSAELKGVGVGGTIKSFKPKVKGTPGSKIKWKLGVTKGAGLREDSRTGILGRGRPARPGFRIKVEF